VNLRQALQIGTIAVVLGAPFCSAMTFGESSPRVEEETVCGWFKERAAFLSWSMTAGRPKPDAWKTVPGSEPVSRKTRDGRTLRGFKISGAGPEYTGAAKGFLLFAQGNAMLADHVLRDLGAFATDNVDVFVYDYRGYGSSEGKRRLKAIVGDYRELFDALKQTYPGRRYLYGVSFGGLVMLNLIGRGADFDRAAIDSAPSRVSVLGCPEQYDPVVNLPQDGRKLLVISGKQDTVVTPADQAELLATAESRRARVLIVEEFAHAFADPDESVHLKRQKMVKEFLLENPP
jgi:hypothetical protein